MKITEYKVLSVSIAPKSCCDIVLDNGEVITCHLDVAAKFGIKKGLLIEQDTIKKLITETRRLEVNKAVFHLLSFKSRTELQIKQKMKLKGFTIEEIEASIRHYKNLGYIDDRDYADSFITAAVNKGKFSEMQIKNKLLGKGIDKTLVEELLGKHTSNETQYKAALNLAKKKMSHLKAKNSKEIKAYLYRYLAQQKFDSKSIYYVLQDILDEPDDDEKEE